jgi:hypothetical protein
MLLRNTAHNDYVPGCVSSEVVRARHFTPRPCGTCNRRVYRSLATVLTCKVTVRLHKHPRPKYRIQGVACPNRGLVAAVSIHHARTGFTAQLICSCRARTTLNRYHPGPSRSPDTLRPPRMTHASREYIYGSTSHTSVGTIIVLHFQAHSLTCWVLTLSIWKSH